MNKSGRKSQYLAKVSLIIMAIGFLVTLPFQDSTLVRLLQGGFEAGLVGGLADWFAVTALFRHPLGIPIPHTALLPKNRDRMIGALLSMLEKDWLTKESIHEKIKQVHFVEILTTLIDKELYSDHFKNGVKLVLRQAIKQVKPEDISPLIERELKSYLRDFEVKPLISSLINQAMVKRLDERALDYGLVEVEKWLVKSETKAKLGVMAKQLIDNTEADGFVKMAIQSFSSFINEEKLGSMLQGFLMKRVVLLKRDGNDYRSLILARVRSELVNVPEKQELLLELEDWKHSFIEQWDGVEQLTKMIGNLQDNLLRTLEEDEFVEKYVLPMIHQSLEQLQASPEKIETWIQKQIFSFVDKNYEKIGLLVKENLDKLDNETLITMLENNVGKDLQWIRVNGAICGFFIGIILTVIKLFV